MDIETVVKELVSSEKDSRNIVQEAKNEGEKLVRKATKDGKALLESKIDEATAKAREMLKSAEERARKFEEELMDDTRRKIASMREKYMNIKGELIEKTISDFLKGGEK